MSETISSVLCPYCGHAQPGGERCEACNGHFDELSRQATQNAMGPWFLHDEDQPFLPGCSYATMQSLIRRGKVTADSVLRGPTTGQFWMQAASAPGIAHLLGACHNCRQPVAATDVCCEYCGVRFDAPRDRQSLGLMPRMDTEAMALGRADAARINEQPQIASLGAERLARMVSERRAVAMTQSDELAAAVNGSNGARTRVASAPELQRRVRRLRRWVGVLAVVNVAVIVAAIVVSAVRGVGRIDGAAPAQPTSSTTEPPIIVEETIGQTRSGEATYDGSYQGSSQRAQSASPDIADADSAGEAEVAPTDGEWMAEYERALSLASEQSIDQLEEALRMLDELVESAEAGSAGQSGEIEQMIERIEGRIERLRVEQALGGEGDG